MTPNAATTTEDPRVTRSKAKILEATLEELGERGYGDLSIEGIAARAGVGKSTIYRHWSTRASLVTDAMGTLRPEVHVPRSGDLRADLLAILRILVAMLTTGRAAALLPVLIEAAERDPELASLHHDFVHERRAPMRTVLREAVERGELPADLDVEVASDLLTGPLFLRRYISREPVTDALAEQIVDTLVPQLDTLCTPRSGRRTRRRRPRHG